MFVLSAACTEKALKKYIPTKGLSSTVILNLPLVNSLNIYEVMIIMLVSCSWIYNIPDIFNILSHFFFVSAITSWPFFNGYVPPPKYIHVFFFFLLSFLIYCLIATSSWEVTWQTHWEGWTLPTATELRSSGVKIPAQGDEWQSPSLTFMLPWRNELCA